VRHALVLAAIASLAACASSSSTTVTPTTRGPLPLDHVIVGIDSLERGMRMLARITGVTPVIGGVHPGRGTRNALLSLGDRTYLELMAPDPAQADTFETVKQLKALHMLTPIGWAIHVTNADSARRAWTRNRLSPGASVPGSRMRPDGRLLRWKTIDPFGVEDPALPFAIEWDSSSVHPASDAPRGCSVAALRITSRRARIVSDLLQQARLDVPVERSDSNMIEVGLTCPTGRINLP